MPTARTGVQNRRTAAQRTRRAAQAQQANTRPTSRCPPEPTTDIDPKGLDSRTELSALLRAWRKRRTPDDFPDQPQLKRPCRRSRHLTVEDAAALSEVSPAWYRSFESGDPNGYSDAFLERVATMLALTNAERATMFLLATGHEPSPHPPASREQISPGIRTCLDAQIWPAYLIDHAGGIIARNHNSLLWFPSQRDETSIVNWLFHNPAAREQFLEWNLVARSTLAYLRAQHARTPRCPKLRETLRSLLDESADARGMWKHKPQVGYGEDGRVRRIQLPNAPAATEVEVVTSTLDRSFDLRLYTLVPVGGHLPEPSSR